MCHVKILPPSHLAPACSGANRPTGQLETWQIATSADGRGRDLTQLYSPYSPPAILLILLPVSTLVRTYAAQDDVLALPTLSAVLAGQQILLPVSPSQILQPRTCHQTVRHDAAHHVSFSQSPFMSLSLLRFKIHIPESPWLVCAWPRHLIE